MSEASTRHKYYWLPNALTVSRILLIPVLVWGTLFARDEYSYGMGVQPVLWTVLIVFLVCMLTDFLDGKLSRNWNTTSDFGRMLDPIADKLLVAASLISITIVFDAIWLILIPSLIIIGRDIFVSGIREHAANASLVLIPTKLAKWKTACEMLAILIFFSYFILAHTGIDMYSMISKLQLSSPDNIAFWTGIVVLWLAAILSAYTGFHYFRCAMAKVAPDLVGD